MFVSLEYNPLPSNESFANYYKRGDRLLIEAYARRLAENSIQEAVIGRPIDRYLMKYIHQQKAFDMGIVFNDREYLNSSKNGELEFSIAALLDENVTDVNCFLYYRKSAKGIPYTIAYARLYGSTRPHPEYFQKPLAWLATAINRKEYYRHFKHRDNNVVSGVMLLIAIALTAGYSLTRDMITPLGEIMRRASQVQRGNFDVKIDLKAKDEFQDLIESFNAMTHGLRERELIRNAFHLYVSSQVAEEILRKGRIDAFADGMRCEVTVLFADIRGFTTYAEQHSPKDVIETLNQYFERIVDIIVQHEGRLDKFIGDGVMATFGDLMPHDDDPYRAVSTAVQIRNQVAELNRLRTESGQEPIYFGMGINTGEAVAGNIGSTLHSELSVIGDAVNQASRIQDAAARNEILITQATYLHVKEYAIVSQPEKIRVKNKPEPLTIYKVLDLKPRAKT
jgi:adenylate cyclase